MNKLETKLLNHYIGYLDARDEYQQSTINQIITTASIYSFYLTSILMLISFIFDATNHKLTFGTFALFVIQQFNSIYIFIRLRKSGVDKTEIDDNIEFSIQLKKLKRQCLVAGLQWGFLMIVFNKFLIPTISGEAINLGLVPILIWVCASIFFGVTMYIIGKSKIVKVK